jgi:hypothetical protein
VVVTGPNPDAALDAALGITELPPAVVDGEHEEIAARLVEEWETDGTAGYGGLEARIAQALADIERRGVQRYIREHQKAHT